MSSAIVIGTQWGDEAKGKVTDILAQNADFVVRYSGGSNAGHSVTSDQGLFKLHLVPSGILSPKTECIISDGVVVDPAVLTGEINDLESRGVSTKRLHISASSHVVMPYHRLLDSLEEERRAGKKIGTTCQGIGPAYTDKARRIGIRMGDFTDPDRLSAVLHESLAYNNLLIEKVYGAKPLEEKRILKEYIPLANQLRPYIHDTAFMVGDAIKANKKVLFESAQGTLLDLDYGTYPYVTSSHPVSGGACLGTGASPKAIGSVIGVVKAYTSRVGEGNFPTELLDPIGDGIRERGHEFGTTTGRPRRVGWLDAVALRFSVMVNGLDRLAITLLDVLSGMAEVKICVAYKTPDGIIDRFPLRNSDLTNCEPVFETFAGWNEDISQIREYSSLPQNARNYLNGIARLVGVPIWMVSVGPHRDQSVYTGQRAEDFWLS